MTSMNRRRFAQLSALTFAATRLPSFAQTAAASSDKPVGFAAVGLGTISDIFMRACANTKAAKITALVTGHPDTKGKKYAEMYGIPETSIYTYDTYDRLRDNKDVDAVYIGLPNSMHREYTLRGAKAGKHVLCEKPMAISSAECREMIDGCKKANVKLMIAYRIHYEPTHLEAKRLIDSGAIGQLQSFEGSFGFSAQPGAWRLTKKMAGGGSLMDVGIYPMNEIRWLTGEEPVGFTAVASTRDHTSGRFAEVEETLDFTIKMPSGIQAALGCSYGSSMPGYLRIHGERGTLEIDPAYDYSGVHLRGIQMRGQRIDITSQGNQTMHFQLEAEHFANCIRTNTEPQSPGEEGLHDMLAIESIYKAAGTPIA
jgi:predicted dehydrogenase